MIGCPHGHIISREETTMKKQITKRTLAGLTAVLCAAGSFPAAAAGGIIGGNALTVYAVTAETEEEIPHYASVYEVATLEEFLAAANAANDGDTVKLTDSFTVEGSYTINSGSSFTVDFNGNTINFDGTGSGKIQSYLYIDNIDAHITFLDHGHGGGMFAVNQNVVRFLKVNKGTVELLSGVYTGGLDIVRTDSNGASVYVRGGSYDLQNDDDDGPFYKSGSGVFVVSGGYYTSRSNVKKVEQDLVEGYEFYETGDEEYGTGVHKIGAVSITGAAVESVADQVYTGSTVTPPLTITDGEKTLTENIDYTVSYADNTEVGTATAYISGIGDYYGTITQAFKIKELPAVDRPEDLQAAFGQTLADVELPAEKDGKWSWEDSTLSVGDVGTKEFKATFTPNDTEHYLTLTNVSLSVTVHHTYTKQEAAEPTCTADGNIEYYICSDGRYYTDDKGENEVALADTVIPATGHSFGKPVWKWSSDLSAAAVYVVCEDCGKVAGKTAEVTSETVQPTYTSAGKTVYTAAVKYKGRTYTDTRTVRIPKLAYTAPTITYHLGGEISWTSVEGAEEYAVVAYLNGKWKILARGNANSYTFNGLRAGERYKVAVIAKVGGEWVADASNAITVIPEQGDCGILMVGANVDGNSIRVNWTAVKGADKYGIAYYYNGKWILFTQVDALSCTIKNVPAGTYRIAVCARIDGKWETSSFAKRSIVVEVK